MRATSARTRRSPTTMRMRPDPPAWSAATRGPRTRRQRASVSASIPAIRAASAGVRPSCSATACGDAGRDLVWLVRPDEDFERKVEGGKGHGLHDGVPAAGLPNSTSTVSLNSSPAARASARWSITANSRIPLASIIPMSRATVSVTGWGSTSSSYRLGIAIRAVSSGNSTWRRGGRRPVPWHRRAAAGTLRI